MPHAVAVGMKQLSLGTILFFSSLGIRAHQEIRIDFVRSFHYATDHLVCTIERKTQIQTSNRSLTHLVYQWET